MLIPCVHREPRATAGVSGTHGAPRATALLALLVAAGCSGEALPSPSSVRALRVVALVTDTPEVAPGASARVAAAWVDPTPGRPFRARWQLCAERDVADPRACPTADRAVDLGEGPAVTTPALTVPGTYFVLVAACAGANPSLSRALGHWRCDDGSAAEEVFRRVRVTETEPRNRPPTIAAWGFARGDASVMVPSGDDASVTLPGCDAGACGAWTVRVVPAAGSAEALPDGGREALSASFYVTSGTTASPRDTANPGEERELAVRWTPGASPSSSVWVVLRDQRGGEAARGAVVTGSGR